jgi:hypothetical protein
MGATAAIGVIVLAIAALGSVRHACAQSAGRQALQAACGADYKRLCPNVLPGGGRIIACMRGHKEELSAACAAALKGAAESRSKSGG